MVQELIAEYRQKYLAEPILVRSPGRVNIIGEHTDYNEGFVLPAAINKAVYVGIGKRTDDRIELYSQEFKQEHSSLLNKVQPSDQHWPNYILGVVDQLQKRGHTLSGFNMVVSGDVPIGAGMSSSAALECAACFALNELLGLKLERREMVKIAQEAEHTFAGVRVGIMDMFASLFGKKDQVIKLDCRSLDFEYVPFQLNGLKLVLFNTNVKHSLASSAYNNRRQQCEQGVAWVRERYPQVKSLRDVTLTMLQELVEPKDEVVYRRCCYVVEENERVLKGVEDLKRGDLVALGKKMFQTHEGLSKLYEVSSAELDFLIALVKRDPGVLGARMMGGGFGGCTINIVRESIIEELIEKASQAYYSSMDLELTTYIVEIENGTSTITDF